MKRVYFSKNANNNKQLVKAVKAHRMRRIFRGIYTDDLTTPPELLIRQHWMQVAAHVVKKGILSHRTAFELTPTPFNNSAIIFMTGRYHKTITLPGLIITVLSGDPQNFTEHVLPNLARSNPARMLLENLTPVRKKMFIGLKTVSRPMIEDYLANELKLRGETWLNTIRDDAKNIAKKLNMPSAFKQLNILISTLLSTHGNIKQLQSPYAKSILLKKPFDKKQLDLFDRCIIHLKKATFIERTYQYQKKSFQYISFFESYFSNFIEGTEFLIDEAEDIVFRGETINHRHADSHDVLANFTLVNDFSEMNRRPENTDDFISLLKERHRYIMKARPDKRPGEFKDKPNKAGNTYFVAPNDVIGTLAEGYERYKILNDGLEKAFFIHLLISEVHPFDDGNGRLSRIMMNAELASAGLFKILIPSVHRDNYLNGLRLASRDQDFRIYGRMLDQAQAYTASIDWQDYGAAREKLEKDAATESPDEGLPIFNRALRQLPLSQWMD